MKNKIKSSKQTKNKTKQFKQTKCHLPQTQAKQMLSTIDQAKTDVDLTNQLQCGRPLGRPRFRIFYPKRFEKRASLGEAEPPEGGFRPKGEKIFFT